MKKKRTRKTNLYGIGGRELVRKAAHLLVILGSFASTSLGHTTLFSIVCNRVVLDQQLVQLEQEYVGIVVVVLERFEHTFARHKLGQKVQRVEFAREPFVQRFLLAKNAHGQIDRLEYAIGRIFCH